MTPFRVMIIMRAKTAVSSHNFSPCTLSLNAAFSPSLVYSYGAGSLGSQRAGLLLLHSDNTSHIPPRTVLVRHAGHLRAPGCTTAAEQPPRSQSFIRQASFVVARSNGQALRFDGMSAQHPA